MDLAFDPRKDPTGAFARVSYEIENRLSIYYVRCGTLKF
jgi:hypothetical protein